MHEKALTIVIDKTEKHNLTAIVSVHWQKLPGVISEYIEQPHCPRVNPEPGNDNRRGAPNGVSPATDQVSGDPNLGIPGVKWLIVKVFYGSLGISRTGFNPI